MWMEECVWCVVRVFFAVSLLRESVVSGGRRSGLGKGGKGSCVADSPTRR